MRSSLNATTERASTSIWAVSYGPADARLLAYHFNLAWPDRSGFLRFDWDASFNTAERDPMTSPPLCHAHLGGHNLIVPSPVMSPLEVLDLLLRHPNAGRPAT